MLLDFLVIASNVFKRFTSNRRNVEVGTIGIYLLFKSQLKCCVIIQGPTLYFLQDIAASGRFKCVCICDGIICMKNIPL